MVFTKLTDVGAGGLVDRRLIRKRNITQFSLGWQINGVDLESSFLAVGVQRRTYVSHHPNTHATS